jgi:hypothetical protein
VNQSSHKHFVCLIGSTTRFGLTGKGLLTKSENGSYNFVLFIHFFCFSHFQSFCSSIILFSQKTSDFFRLRFVGIWCRYGIEFVATMFIQFIQFLTQPNVNYQIWSSPSIPCQTRFILTKIGEINLSRNWKKTKFWI